MLKNLPKQFPIEKLEDFTFGSREAQTDALLREEECVCQIEPIRKFLGNRHSIVVGSKGTGKTALFTLVSRGILKFDEPKGDEIRVLAINEELQYQSIREQTLSRISTTVNNPVFHNRIVWEVFFLYRILKYLIDELPTGMPAEIDRAKKQLVQIFNPETAGSSWKSLLFNREISVGVKLDETTGIVVPTGFVTFKPSAPEASQSIPPGGPTLNLDIDYLKNQIQAVLSNARKTLVVMVDQLDEFLVGKEYDAQRESLQGLLHCERAYLQFPNIKLKLFIREDLYRKLNFEELGQAKTEERKIDLYWTDSNIQEIVGRRIAYNLAAVIGAEVLRLEMNGDIFYGNSNERPRPSPLSLRKMLCWLRMRNRRTKQQQLDALQNERKVNFTDVINQTFITGIFPRTVTHCDPQGKVRQIPIIKYLVTHFCSSHGHTNPRTIIMFLQLCLDRTREYYRNNPDQAAHIMLDANNEYPLIKPDVMQKSYRALQKTLIDDIATTNTKWQTWFRQVQSKQGGGKTLSFKQAQEFVGTKDRRQLRNFFAFLNHVGFVKCLNESADDIDREYELPLLFRTSP